MVTVSAAVVHFALGLTTIAYVLLGLISVAATLESVSGFCTACRIFGV